MSEPLVRRRNVQSNAENLTDPIIERLRSLDAFTKVAEEAEAPATLHGGICTTLALSIMGILLISEIFLWVFHTNIKYEFDVDDNFKDKLNLNFDITVNSRCSGIGADIIDSSGDAWRYMVQINEQQTEFQPSEKIENERKKLLKIKEKHAKDGGLSKALLREGHDVAHLEKAKSANEFDDHLPKMIQIRVGGDKPACRFWGSIPLNKVAGNFHIMSGKAIPHPMGHAHMNFFGMENQNFSHRIDHFSFGDPTSGLLYPLDGDLVLQDLSNTQFNYIINVVPTRIKTFKFSKKTYQYAVTQHTKVLPLGKHSHSSPGIFFKYDFSGIGVEVTENREALSSLLTRLAGILGGIFASSGIMSSIIATIPHK